MYLCDLVVHLNQKVSLEIYGNSCKYIIIISMVMAKQFLRIQNNSQMPIVVRYLLTICYLSNLLVTPDFQWHQHFLPKFTFYESGVLDFRFKWNVAV